MFYNKRWIIDDEQFYIRTHCHRFANAFFFTFIFQDGSVKYQTCRVRGAYCKRGLLQEILFTFTFFKKISSIASLNFSIGRRSSPLSLRTVIIPSFKKEHLQKCHKPITIFLCLRVVVVVVFKLLVASKVGLSNDPWQRRLECTNTPRGLI